MTVVFDKIASKVTQNARLFCIPFKRGSWSNFIYKYWKLFCPKANFLIMTFNRALDTFNVLILLIMIELRILIDSNMVIFFVRTSLNLFIHLLLVYIFQFMKKSCHLKRVNRKHNFNFNFPCDQIFGGSFVLSMDLYLSKWSSKLSP